METQTTMKDAKDYFTTMKCDLSKEELADEIWELMTFGNKQDVLMQMKDVKEDN